jgi:hypothetical protein
MGLAAIQLAEPRHRGCRNSTRGAAPSRVYGRYGAPATVGNQKRRAIRDTHGEHQRRVAAHQPVGSRLLAGVTRVRIDDLRTMNLVNGGKRAAWDATGRRQLIPSQLAIRRARKDREFPRRPPMSRDTGERRALE